MYLSLCGIRWIRLCVSNVAGFLFHPVTSGWVALVLMRHVVTHLTFQIGQLRRISLAGRFLLVWKQYCRIHGSLAYSTYAIKRYSRPLPPAWPPKDHCELWCLYRKQGTLWGVLLSHLVRRCDISSSSSCDIGSHHTFMNNFGSIHLKSLKSLHLPLRKRSVLNISLIWFCSPLSSSDNWGLLWIRWNIQETFREARGADGLTVTLGRS